MLDRFVFVHDQYIIEEGVDSSDAFSQDFGSTSVIVYGIFLWQVGLHSYDSSIKSPFFFCFKQVRIYLGIVGILDHIPYTGVGLKQVGLAHEICLDERIGSPGSFCRIECIRCQYAVDDMIIHAFILENIFQAQREVFIELAYDFCLLITFYMEQI